MSSFTNTDLWHRVQRAWGEPEYQKIRMKEWKSRAHKAGVTLTSVARNAGIDQSYINATCHHPYRIMTFFKVERELERLGV